MPLLNRSVRLAAALLFTLLGACTTLPTQEFAAYKDAFAKARMAGEEVLVDHAALRAQRAELETRASLAAGAKPPPRVVPFKPEEIMLAGQAVDHVAVRFRAWEVVARYNEALTRLAEGKSSQDVVSAVDGLVQSLSDFPLDEIQGLATSIAPLRIIIAEAERERSRQEFLEVLAKGSPLIKDHFIKLLRDDTGDFRNLKLGLNTLQYNPLLRQVGREVRRCETLANAHAQTEPMTGLRNGINAALMRLPTDQAERSPVPAMTYTAAKETVPFTPFAQNALQQCKDGVDDAVERALAKHAEMVAYDEVLKAYLVLLSKVAGSLTAVEEAARKSTPSAPPSRELLGAFITLRQTLLSLRTKE